MLVPADRVVQVSIAASQRHGADPEDLAIFRPQRHLAGDTTVTLLQLTLALEADQDLTLRVIPSPSPADGLLVRAHSRAS